MRAGFLGFKGDEGGRSSVAEARVGRWYGHSGREGLERVPHRGETLFYGAHINCFVQATAVAKCSRDSYEPGNYLKLKPYRMFPTTRVIALQTCQQEARLLDFV